MPLLLRRVSGAKYFINSGKILMQYLPDPEHNGIRMDVSFMVTCSGGGSQGASHQLEPGGPETGVEGDALTFQV